MKSGSLCLSFVGMGPRGKQRHRCKSMNMCGDPWEDRRISLWLYILLSLPLVSCKRDSRV